MKKLAINFANNHSFSCYYALMKTFLFAYDFTKSIPYNKKIICLIVNELIYGYYLLIEGCEEQNSEIKLSFKIEPDNVYIDDEVDQILKTNDDCNHELFIADFENNRVYSF